MSPMEGKTILQRIPTISSSLHGLPGSSVCLLTELQHETDGWDVAVLLMSIEMKKTGIQAASKDAKYM